MTMEDFWRHRKTFFESLEPFDCVSHSLQVVEKVIRAAMFNSHIVQNDASF
jgi:hypothetical protein